MLYLYCTSHRCPLAARLFSFFGRASPYRFVVTVYFTGSGPLKHILLRTSWGSYRARNQRSKTLCPVPGVSAVACPSSRVSCPGVEIWQAARPPQQRDGTWVVAVVHHRRGLLVDADPDLLAGPLRAPEAPRPTLPCGAPTQVCCAGRRKRGGPPIIFRKHWTAGRTQRESRRGRARWSR